MVLDKPIDTGILTDVQISDADLSKMPCGLHRATLSQAVELVPELEPLYLSLPKEVIDEIAEDPESWVIDVKIHMLMKRQFPCVPNWHCDNVPRDTDGKLQYGNITSGAKPMYLWLSGGPCTEFLPLTLVGGCDVKSHGDLDTFINGLVDKQIITPERIQPQRWYKMNQLTPHRGVPADSFSWRIFCRLTHKSLIDGYMARQQVSPLRRHAQVYLPSNFHW